MVSTAERLSDKCIRIEHSFLYKHEDGKYGDTSMRNDVVLITKLLDFLSYEENSRRGAYYSQINELLISSKIKGFLCLAH